VNSLGIFDVLNSLPTPCIGKAASCRTCRTYCIPIEALSFLLNYPFPFLAFTPHLNVVKSSAARLKADPISTNTTSLCLGKLLLLIYRMFYGISEAPIYQVSRLEVKMVLSHFSTKYQKDLLQTSQCKHLSRVSMFFL